MKRTAAFLSLALTLAMLAGCQSAKQNAGPSAAPVPVPIGTREAPLLRAKNWLFLRQNADGSWGSGDRQLLLTSMATLAFLSKGQTPTSPDFGPAVDKGLRFLARNAGKRNASQDARVKPAIAWCLAEAYRTTKEPAYQKALLGMPRLTEQDPAVWRVLAAKAILRSGADPSFDRNAFLALCPPAAPPPTNGIERLALLLAFRETGRLEEAKALVPPPSSYEEWKTSALPFPHLFLLRNALSETGGPAFTSWSKSLAFRIANAQGQHRSMGWWTPESLGVDKAPEMQGLTGTDASLYATAWMLLCHP